MPGDCRVGFASSQGHGNFSPVAPIGTKPQTAIEKAAVL